MTLMSLPPEQWQGAARWLVPGANCTSIGYAIVLRALIDDGIMESPVGSNRGTSIDHWLRRAGVDEDTITSGKGYWCAAWAGSVFLDNSCLVPAGYASTRTWLPYVVDKPEPGHAILYGANGVPHHIGIVSRVSPLLVTIEGNRSWAGTASNNGVCVDQGPPQRRDIMGFIPPTLKPSDARAA